MNNSELRARCEEVGVSVTEVLQWILSNIVIKTEDDRELESLDDILAEMEKS